MRPGSFVEKALLCLAGLSAFLFSSLGVRSRAHLSLKIDSRLHWLEFAYDSSDNSLDNAVLHVNRFHRAVCRLKADSVSFTVKSFQCGKGVVEQGYDHLAVARRRVPLNDHVVAVQDAVLDH